MDTDWMVFGVPAIALALAGCCLGYLWLASLAFDRKWHHCAPAE